MDMKRMGIFSIPRKVIEVLEKDLRKKIFGEIIILEAAYSIRDDETFYLAAGDMFDKVTNNFTVPEALFGARFPLYESPIKWIPDGESGNGKHIFKGGKKLLMLYYHQQNILIMNMENN